MTKRLSVTLSDDDEVALAAFSSGAGRMTLRAWAAERGLSLGRSPSEAALLRVLVRAGAEALQVQGLDAGYAALAAELSSSDTREARRRYVARTDSATGP
ncbi:MAG TPA: hypothetical protein VFD41_12800 [Actinomycetales bacterium]|nr:hypothetical protein [Actinomycetales bacterium]